jgi:hypothetical protein
MLPIIARKIVYPLLEDRIIQDMMIEIYGIDG